MTTADVNGDGIAMDGFDPVAYYNGEPLRGTEQFTAQWENLTFWFSSQEYLDLFLASPDKYMPNSGGISAGMKGAANDGKNEFFLDRQDLQDSRVSMETNVPIDTMQDGSVEHQNLSDDEN